MVFRKHNSRPFWVKWIFIGGTITVIWTVAVLALMTLYTMRDYYYNAPLNPALPAQGVVVENEDTSISHQKPPLSEMGIILAEDAENTPEPIPTLQSDDRLTVLVMGLDRRTGENFVSRTDTMILFSINPGNQTASLLSVPRDLYVDIPYYGYSRINTAFVVGASNGGEQGGATLAMQTVETSLGVQVDHYVLLDFDTVVNVIDEFDGVTIDVPYTIDDPLYPDMNYGYDPFYIEAGEHTMDGELALKYMRTRHVDNDFGRSRRQQQLIMALRDQMLGQGIRGLARRAPFVYRQVKDGIFTDMSLNDMVSIANAGSGISAENIKTGVMDYNYVTTHTTAEGASVLLVRDEPVATLIADLFD